jgi:arylsulfatase A-like enzyme
VAQVPETLDSLSFVPTLRGRDIEQAKHEFLYWEFHEGGFKQAALLDGRWKGIRRGRTEPLFVFDLEVDPAELHNVAAERPEITAKLTEYLKTARRDSKDWEPRWRD